MRGLCGPCGRGRTGTRPRREDERGAVTVVVAVALTVVLFAASFSVDIGRLVVRRADAQTAADMAALAALLHLPSGTGAAAAEAAEVVEAQLGPALPPAEWAAAWSVGRCSDPGKLAIGGVVHGAPTDCISFDGRGTVRVKVPDQVLRTTFAQVMGISQLSTTASGRARIDPLGQQSVLPFAALAGVPAGSVFCLRSATSGQASPPCTGSASGNYGPLSIPQHGDSRLGTTVVPCNTDKATQFAVNLSTGIDHVVLPYNGTPVLDSCARPFAPNTLELFQGIGGGLWSGLVAGTTVGGVTFPGRLLTSSGPSRTLRHAGNDLSADNRPLWDYLAPGKGLTVPPDCLREAYPGVIGGTGAATADTLLALCLTTYAAAPPGTFAPLFDADTDGDGHADLVTSRRFAFIPQSADATFPSGNSGSVRIARFLPVFLNTLQFGCSGGGMCNVVFTPGTDPSPLPVPNGSNPLDQVTGYSIPPASLPPGLQANGVNGLLGVYRPQLVP